MLVSLGDARHKASHVGVRDGEPVSALVLLPGRDAPSVLHLHLCHVSGSRELFVGSYPSLRQYKVCGLGCSLMLASIISTVRD